MQFREIESRILGFMAEGRKVFVSTSFQTQSLPLLHMISRIDRSIPVYFVHTGFHFPETLQFKDQVTGLLGLTTVPDRGR